MINNTYLTHNQSVTRGTVPFQPAEQASTGARAETRLLVGGLLQVQQLPAPPLVEADSAVWACLWPLVIMAGPLLPDLRVGLC